MGKKLEYPDNLTSKLTSIDQKILIGRVTDIILNDQHPLFETYGGYPSIGSIVFQQDDIPGKPRSIAFPFFPQMSAYPLVNELVMIFSLPTKNIGKLLSSKTYYYINVIGIWNSPHHNAYPNPLSPETPGSINKDYEQTVGGSVVRKTDYNSTTKDGNSIRLNSNSNLTQDTFIERINIHPLLPFAGDVIYEGRWGNSIRLGSTAQNGAPDEMNLNNWSDIGTNGDPLTIIRNGQPENIDKNGWETITEDIEKDLSSIYLTSTQLINIFPRSSFASYKKEDAPDSPSSYSSNQVLINSGRLFFGSNKDHILLNAKKTISFNSRKGFNFDTPSDFIVQAGDLIKLGGKDACEPLVLGDALKSDLDFMLSVLIQLVGVIEFSTLYPGGLPVPDSSTSLVASNCKEALQNIKDNLDNILSKKSKTL